MKLHTVRIEGFKSFKDAVDMGPFPYGLSAIVGANGCGKSVIGEAIAFALGGGKALLRAKQLSSLVNSDLAQQHHPEAQVTLTFESKVGRLAAARKLGPSGTECLLLEPGYKAWRKVTQEELRGCLMAQGLNVSALERFIVVQQRSAIAVDDPLALSAFLERLAGLADLEACIASKAGELQAAAQQCESFAAESERLHARQTQEQNLRLGLKDQEQRAAQLSSTASVQKAALAQLCKAHRAAAGDQAVAALQEEQASASMELEAARAEDAARKQAAAQQDSAVSKLQVELAGLQAAADKQAAAEQQRQATQSSLQTAADDAARAAQGCRLTSLAHASTPALALPVNAALREMCNVASCLVVDTRVAAEEVLRTYETRRAGIATCKIVAEHDQDRHGHMSLPACTGLEPLLAHVEVEAEAAGAAQAAVQLRAQAPQRGHACHIVTFQGEVFKADGEVASARPPSFAQQSDLITAKSLDPAVHAAPKNTASAETADHQQRLDSLIQQERLLAKQVAAKNRQARAAEEQAQAAAGVLARHLRTHAPQRRTPGVGAQGVGETAQAVQRMRQLLEAAQAKQRALHHEAGQEFRLHELEAAACALQERYETVRTRTDGGTAVLSAERELARLEAEARQAAAEVATAQQAARKLARSLGSMRSERSDPSALAGQAPALEARSASQSERISSADSALQELRAGAERAGKRARAASAALQKAEQAYGLAVTRADAERAALDEAATSLAAKVKRKEKVAAALAAIPPPPEPRAPAGQPPNPDPEAQRSAKRRASAAVECLNTGDPEQEALALAAEEDHLEERQASIDTGALRADLDAALRLEALAGEAAAAEAALLRLEEQKRALQVEKYERFSGVLRTANAALAAIYRQLTGGQGDAYLAFADDRLLLFADGITLHVRPDQHRWRPFGALSGGQKALSTLALLLALQAALPSPFYVFDEVDCSLDTAAAARVGAFLRAQTNAQFIVVSHKAQVYEQADCIVGVHTYQGASTAVTLLASSGEVTAG
ncbi:hypothetical protein WJX81_001928 [Elliptochloris bilobata]|uniref:RecF/RecN/SMC N-terminal domain-containing protein n=1 Tax=Elliptochloris bilobata TaxID=381761 RepID=A0AAW1SCQ2_9CHLO